MNKIQKVLTSTMIIAATQITSGCSNHRQMLTQQQSNQEIKQARLDIEVTKTYLHFPISHTADEQKISIVSKNKLTHKFDMRLVDVENADSWIYIDMTDYLGQTISINTDQPTTQGLSDIYQDNNFHGHDKLYQEALRPLVHFTAKQGWLNDPNGLVYHDGEYHLYFQHNPYGTRWGNMHWGHAVSNDLLHWQELPIVLKPYDFTYPAYSGSAVVDVNNTAGFSADKNNPAIVALFTSEGRGEALAYSIDKGRSFTEIEDNPLIVHDGRDPKIFWHEDTKRWIMVLYSQESSKASNGQTYNKRLLKIYNSSDLKEWQYQSAVEGFYECPELFELPIQGNEQESRWIMYGGTGDYLIGDFDGKVFTPNSPMLNLVTGSFYASQTYNNQPENRRIQIGWAPIESPKMPFNKLMAFPTELTLVNTVDGLRMRAQPIKEIKKLHGSVQQVNNHTLTNDTPMEIHSSADAVHIIAEFEVLDDFAFGIEINDYKIHYNTIKNLLDKSFIRQPSDKQFRFEIIVDKTSIEYFVNNGERYHIAGHIDKAPGTKVKVYSKSPSWYKGSTLLKQLSIYDLNSIWQQ